MLECCHGTYPSAPYFADKHSQGTMQHSLSHHTWGLIMEAAIAVKLYLRVYARGTESQGREWLP